MFARSLSRPRGWRNPLVPVSVLALATAPAVLAQEPRGATLTPAPDHVQCAPDNGGITLPDGFCATVFADDVGRARHIARRPTGDVYVAIGDAPDGADIGRVLALRDGDGDGNADCSCRFGDRGGNGITWLGHLFFARERPHRPLLLPPGASSPSAGADHRVRSARDRRSPHQDGRPGHRRHRQPLREHRLGVQRVPGREPRARLARHRSLSRARGPRRDLAVRRHRPRPAQASGARFATGLRNMTALALNPRTARCGARTTAATSSTRTGRSSSRAEEDLLLPVEELFRLDRGADYGWPYCYYDPRSRARCSRPSTAATATIEGRCAPVA